MLSIKKYKCFVWLFVMLLASAPALAQQQIMNLDSVLQRISSSNPMLQEYDYRARAMDAYAEGARSWMAPMVGGGVFMMPYSRQSVERDEREGSYMLSAEQAIPNPAKLRAKEKYLKSRAAIETAGRDVTFNQLRAQAKAAYYSWVVLEKKMDVLQDSEHIMEYMLKLAKIRYPYSQGSLGSVYKAEGRLHEVQNMQLMTASQMEQQNVQLNILMNLPKEQRYRIDTAVMMPEPALLAVDTSSLINVRSDLRQLDKTVQSMRLNVELEQLERKPDFRIRFDHMYPRNSMMPQQFTAMGMVSIPIAPWSSKMYKANTKAMNLEIEAMQQERESIVNEAQGMIRNMALELNTLWAQTENYQKKIIPALKKNYDVTMLAYEQNTAQLPEAIDAWEALNMAQMEYLNRLQELYLMVVNYEKEIEK
ncbi:TolC family protein [Pontibacter mangrovi]|uniref:TolC family protein n=2 Tax=Pseudomonadati TaxID=3379134 RepID=A0A501WNR5_9RHOB|nr:TolC family protein [Pontibacter mangrovi]TPE41522.1 TolC family protein [Pontibacter mangrovi]TPE48651.1 TolC family protein [Amaricoccus solimangrovi]